MASPPVGPAKLEEARVVAVADEQAEAERVSAEHAIANAPAASQQASNEAPVWTSSRDNPAEPAVVEEAGAPAVADTAGQPQLARKKRRPKIDSAVMRSLDGGGSSRGSGSVEMHQPSATPTAGAEQTSLQRTASARDRWRKAGTMSRVQVALESVRDRQVALVSQSVALLDAAAVTEPAITTMLTEITRDFAGARMHGLDFKFKGLPSLVRKVRAKWKQEGAKRGIVDLLAEQNDCLRYTMVFPDAVYVQGVEATLDTLEKSTSPRLRRLGLKNFWRPDVADREYLGLHATFECLIDDRDDAERVVGNGTTLKGEWTNGTRFEVQWHTEDTIQTKEEQCHLIYEKFRTDLDVDHKTQYWVSDGHSHAHSSLE